MKKINMSKSRCLQMTISLFVAISIIFLIPIVGTFASSNSDYAYSIIKEISNPKYKGRIAGTEEYRQAAQFIKGEFSKMTKIKPLGPDFIQEYPTNTGVLSDIPKLSIDGNQLEVMKDFKPHGRSASGTVTASKIVFVGKGYEEDYAGLDVKGAIVFMDANIKEGKSLGVADRFLIAKSKGAVAVLTNPNDFYPMTSFERPITGIDCGCMAFYVSTDILNSKSMKIGQILNKRVEMTCNISRTSSTSQNIAGFIEGNDTSKTVVVSATLDGLGYIPDGKVFNAASMNGSGVAAVLSIAKYFNDSYYKPACNIIFAIIGSETTNRDGITNFLKMYSGSKISAFYNIYDIGNRNQTGMWIKTPSKYADLNNSVKSNGGTLDSNDNVSSDLANFNNSVVESKGIPNVFIRCCDSAGNSLNDTIENIDKANLDDNIILIRRLILKYLDKLDTNKTSFVPDANSEVFVPEVNHNMKFIATKYFDIFYEPDYQNADKLAEKADEIYPFIAWWNYYPKDIQRIKLYFTKTYDDEWATAHRTPETLSNGQSNKSTGGLQSPDNHSISACSIPVGRNDAINFYGTIEHELNHDLATYKLKELGYGNWYKTDVQEIEGHVNFFNSMQDGKNYFKSVLALFGQPIENTKWDKYVADQEAGKEMASTYDKTASLIYYIYEVYSKTKAREFVYRMYDEGKSLEQIERETLGIDFSTFVKRYFDWYNGKPIDYDVDLYNKSLYKLDTADNMYCPEAQPVNANNLSTGNSNENTPVNSSSSILTSEDNNIVYHDINYWVDGLTDGYKLDNLMAGTDNTDIFIKLECTIPKAGVMSVFLQGDAPGLKEMWNTCAGKNKYVIKLDKNRVKSFTAGLAINLGDRNFIFINKEDIDSLAEINPSDIITTSSSNTTSGMEGNNLPDAPFVNPVSDSCTTIEGKAGMNLCVTLKSGTTIFGTSKTNTDGTFLIKIPKQKAGTVIYATAYDISGNASKPTKIIVNDGTPPPSPIVKPIYNTDKTVSGKSEINAIITIKCKGVVVATGKANDKGVFNIPLKSQKTGTVLEITAKDTAGNCSGFTKAIVKKK